MTCEESRKLIDPYLDQEVDPTQQEAMRKHLEGCAGCRKAVEEQRALSQAIREGYEPSQVPASLRRQIHQATVDRPKRGGFWLGTAFGAAAVLLFVFLWPKATVPAEDLVNRHIQAMAGRLIDVASSDRHTVKPWFQGKIDFSPEIPDLASQGFPLVGGRLDRIFNRPTATLVYRRRAHIINVFVSAGETRAGEGDLRGFHVRHFALHDLDYWVVSDVSPEELSRFKKAFAEAAKSPPAARPASSGTAASPQGPRPSSATPSGR